MITDNPLIMASAEAVPNGAATPGGLGGNSITTVAGTPYVIDLLAANNPLGYNISDLGTSVLELSVSIPTAFTTTTPASTLEWQLVSLPILPTLLSAATTSGRLLSLAGLSVPAGTDVVTITGHGLQLGTPFYFSAGSGGSGTALNTLYFAIPQTADTFKFATSLANALAGTFVDQTVADFTGATIVFMPVLHATTGAVPTVYLKKGARVTGTSLRQLPAVGGKLIAPYSGATPMPVGASLLPSDATGGGGGTAVVMAPGRYLALRVIAAGANSDTTGRYSVHVGLNAHSDLAYYPSGLEVR